MNFLRLPLSFDPAALRDDLARVAPDEWVTHYNADDFEGDWRGVALRALGGQTGNLRALPGVQMLYDDTPLLARCPHFQSALASLQCPVGAARLLALSPGSIIREHRDVGLSPEAGEVRLHVPVQTHRDVEFYLGGERVTMLPGECWFLDFSQPHRAVNRSSVERVHLVVDCAVNAWLARLLKENASDAE